MASNQKTNGHNGAARSAFTGAAGFLTLAVAFGAAALGADSQEAQMGLGMLATQSTAFAGILTWLGRREQKEVAPVPVPVPVKISDGPQPR